MAEPNRYTDISKEISERYIKWIENTDLSGYGYVEITDTLPSVFIPESFYKWCLSIGISPQNAICMIISDFMIHINAGSSDKNIISRILNSHQLTDEEKKKTMRVIYDSKIEI